MPVLMSFVMGTWLPWALCLPQLFPHLPSSGAVPAAITPEIRRPLTCVLARVISGFTNGLVFLSFGLCVKDERRETRRDRRVSAGHCPFKPHVASGASHRIAEQMYRSPSLRAAPCVGLRLAVSPWPWPIPLAFNSTTSHRMSLFSLCSLLILSHYSPIPTATV